MRSDRLTQMVYPPISGLKTFGAQTLPPDVRGGGGRGDGRTKHSCLSPAGATLIHAIYTEQTSAAEREGGGGEGRREVMRGG